MWNKLRPSLLNKQFLEHYQSPTHISTIQDWCENLFMFYKFVFIFSNLADAVVNFNGFNH